MTKIFFVTNYLLASYYRKVFFMENFNQLNSSNPVYPIKVNDETFHFNREKVTGKQILEKAGLVPIECHSLYRKLRNDDFTKIGLDEEVNISNIEINHFITKEAEVFNYHINHEPEMTDKKFLTPVEILKFAGIDPIHSYLIKINQDGSETELAYKEEEKIRMICTGLKFKTEKWRHEVVIEEYGKECKLVPPALKYFIKIDKTTVDFHHPLVSGTQILTKANKLPVNKFDLFKILGTNPQPIKIKELEAYIDLREKCLVRFVTIPKEQRDGE